MCVVDRKCTLFESTKIWNWPVFLHFFIIWISCTPGAPCYQNWLSSCKALLNHSTIQSNLCHFMFARICTSYTVHLILWQEKEKALFLPPKNKIKKHTHGHFSLLLVTSWHVFLSVSRERQKLASEEDEDKRQTKTESNWLSKSAGAKDFFSKVSMSAVRDWREQRSCLI